MATTHRATVGRPEMWLLNRHVPTDFLIGDRRWFYRGHLLSSLAHWLELEQIRHTMLSSLSESELVWFLSRHWLWEAASSTARELYELRMNSAQHGARVRTRGARQFPLVATDGRRMFRPPSRPGTSSHRKRKHTHAFHTCWWEADYQPPISRYRWPRIYSVFYFLSWIKVIAYDRVYDTNYGA